jgi:arylsulfatase
MIPAHPALVSEESRPISARAVLGVALASALLAAALGGALDALLAWSHFRSLPSTAIEATRMDRVSDLLGGIAGATLLHAGLQVSSTLPVLALAGVVLRRRVDARRWRSACVAAALTPPLFALAYWHTREHFFYGLPATSTPRLAVALGLLLGAAGLSLLLARSYARAAANVRRGAVVGALALTLVGAAWSLWHARDGERRGALNGRNVDVPNVVLVVVDALRADALGCYGNATVSTPNLDRLAREGALFEQAYANAPFTGTSFASFFTGQYPRRHGMLTMGPGVEVDAGATFAELLDGGRRVDGTRMEEGDVVAAAFMTGALSHGSGLMAGFDAYRELTLGHALVDLSNRWSVFRSELVPSILWSKLEAKLDDDLLVHAARDWMAAHADRRFAMFVHLYSTHTPYDPPEPFRSQYIDPEYEGPFESFYAGHRIAIEQGDYTPSEADVRRIYDLYLAGVALADHHVGILLDELEALGIADDTLVLLTSDHGEDFGASSDPASGDPGRWEHNHMYRSNLRIPLVMRWPTGVPAGVRVQAPVEGVDLFPTIASAAGLEVQDSTDPRQLVDGLDLLPLARGERSRHKPYLFAEDATYVSIQDGRHMLTLERYAVADDGWRIVLDEGLGSVRYHDFEQDPTGETDLFTDVVRIARPEVASAENRARVMVEVERLRAALLDWNATQPIGVETVARSARDVETQSNRDAAMTENLARLGYVEGWDNYSGALRERVMALRENAGQRASGNGVSGNGVSGNGGANRE